MLHSRLLDVPICVLDVETTGASIDYGDRVTELGIVRIERGEVVARYEQLVNPGRRISGGASAITGITSEMLADQPAFCDVWEHARVLLQGSILVGHNVGFDLSFLAGECRRFCGALCDALGDIHVLDTVRIARKQLGRGGNGLQRLAGRLGLAPASAHRAMVDCETTAGVLHKLIEPHGAWQITVQRACELQGGAWMLSDVRTRTSVLPAEISEALTDGSAVQIRYLDARNIRTDRVVTPRFVRRIGGSLTLVAHCHLKNEQRMFKIDRIISVLPVPAVGLELFAPIMVRNVEAEIA